ncbi:hypothetical protein K402DRAFT_178394 [Aulographum hederae CBS 113979]|uniref:Uncharacterized protein n=1 Tax=Aulographum hederae CBS 113979 TaxID=1176131 RepID=A0A6G1GQP0_9PEZI|nr:hypothetical protein K402DRAFT_178394 [Aulographum hederae CBS 113979]
MFHSRDHVAGPTFSLSQLQPLTSILNVSPQPHLSLHHHHHHNTYTTHLITISRLPLWLCVSSQWVSRCGVSLRNWLAEVIVSGTTTSVSTATPAHETFPRKEVRHLLQRIHISVCISSFPSTRPSDPGVESTPTPTSTTTFACRDSSAKSGVQIPFNKLNCPSLLRLTSQCPSRTSGSKHYCMRRAWNEVRAWLWRMVRNITVEMPGLWTRLRGWRVCGAVLAHDGKLQSEGRVSRTT